MKRQPPRSTLFPYPTLFRSRPRCRAERSPVHLAHRAYVLVLLTAVMAIAGIWSSEPALADLWRIPAGLLLLDRKSTRLNSSHGYISYAAFCFQKTNSDYFCL